MNNLFRPIAIRPANGGKTSGATSLGACDHDRGLRGRLLAAVRFVLHMAEMVLAMQVGMWFFHTFLCAKLMGDPTLHELVMDLYMTAPMVAVMVWHGHGCRHSAEMAAAMLAGPELFYAGNSLSAVMEPRGPLRQCLEEAAAKTGRQAEITEYAPSDAMHQDDHLSVSYRSNWRALCGAREQDPHVQEEMCEVVPFGQRFFRRWILRRMRHALFLDKLPADVLWGSDLGSASRSIPAIQPFIGIGGMAAAHTLPFTDKADSAEGYAAMLTGGVAMAWTALDAATDPDLKDYLLRTATARKRTLFAM